MSIHPLASQDGRPLELDICFACQGLWFDPQENLKLAPASVVELFRLLHEQRDAPRHPLAARLACPRCERSLEKGFDVVRSGRYVTYRCPSRHGRFSAFSSFMVEKGFVRQLTKPEIDDIAQRVAIITCTGCGAPVDIRKDHACPHCRSPLALLDPTRVEAQQNEGRLKRLALLATVARLQAEASGKPLVFPKELDEVPQVVQVDGDLAHAIASAQCQSIREQWMIADREQRLG